MFFNIMFTGHEATCACEELENGGYIHVFKTGLKGRAEGIGTGNRCAVFAGFEDANNKSFARLKYTMVHEILHLLGAKHHEFNDIEQCVHVTKYEAGTIISDNGEIVARLAIDEIQLSVCAICKSRTDDVKLSALYNHYIP